MTKPQSKEIEALYVSRMAEWAADNGTEHNWDLSHALSNLCQSEIERRLLVELYFANWHYGDWENVEIYDYSVPYPMDEKAVVVLAPQFPCAPYAIDIAVFARGQNGERLKIAVECDGHDYHERTKEQAQRDKKRDREIQKAGYMVFRFTGSEIFRLGKKRAEEIADYVGQWIDGTVRRVPREK